VLNDSGSTLDYIIKTYQRDVKDFVQNGDMSELLYDALYDYYQDDMPYGVKKARTGDPYEWIGDRFHDDLQGSDMVDEAGVQVRKVRSPNIVQVQAVPSADIKSMKFNDDPLPMTNLDSSPMAQGPDISLSMMDLDSSPVAGLDISDESELERIKSLARNINKDAMDEADYDLGYQDNQLPFVNPQASYVMPANAAEREQDVKDFGHLTKNQNLGNPNSIVNKNVTPSAKTVPFGQNNRTTTGYVMPANDAERAADLKDFGPLTSKFNLGSNRAPAMEDKTFDAELARIKSLSSLK
jgi:hypothetical protein